MDCKVVLRVHYKSNRIFMDANRGALADASINDQISVNLAGKFDRTCFADDGHLNLTGVLHGFLDLFGDITRQTG